MTVTTNQRYCSQIQVIMEVIIEITAEVLTEVINREHISIINICQHYRRVLAQFLTQQIYKVADGVRIVYSGEHAGIVGVLLTGLNSSSGVNRFHQSTHGPSQRTPFKPLHKKINYSITSQQQDINVRFFSNLFFKSIQNFLFIIYSPVDNIVV